MSTNIKKCHTCQAEFNIYHEFEGKIYRLKNRKNCYTCNPFKIVDNTPKIKTCHKCGNTFPQSYKHTDGETYSLQRRNFCLTCSPFKKHNTRNLTIVRKTRSRNSRYYQQMSPEEKKDYNGHIVKLLQARRIERKIKLINYKGGKCIKCGYCKNYSALHFHHREPDKKSFELDSRIIASKNWENILKEAEKCDLLCSICHVELHNPQCLNKQINFIDYEI